MHPHMNHHQINKNTYTIKIVYARCFEDDYSKFKEQPLVSIKTRSFNRLVKDTDLNIEVFEEIYLGGGGDSGFELSGLWIGMEQILVQIPAQVLLALTIDFIKTLLQKTIDLMRQKNSDVLKQQLLTNLTVTLHDGRILYFYFDAREQKYIMRESVWRKLIDILTQEQKKEIVNPSFSESMKRYIYIKGYNDWIELPV